MFNTFVAFFNIYWVNSRYRWFYVQWTASLYSSCYTYVQVLHTISAKKKDTSFIVDIQLINKYGETNVSLFLTSIQWRWN